MEEIMKITSPYTDKLIQNHQFQAQSNNCGPFCAAMSINMIKGTHLDGNDLAASMNRPRFNIIFPIIRRIPDYATFPWGIVDTLGQNKINASWKFFYTFSDLSTLLPGTNLLIILTATYEPLNGHYRILVSLEDDQIGFIDPAYPVNGIHYQPRPSFLLEWQNAFNPIIMIRLS
jgi:hypothetical protein